MEEKWDLIINIGHVVPHEVLGFANHNKNYFIGLGGKDLICASHMMAASCGIENNLGCLITPVRACFNRAEDRFLAHLPDLYVQVVMARDSSNRLVHTGLYVGDDLDTYLAAARQSREQNITVFDRPVSKIVCVMQADEFVSTWVANKAIYRTRMAIADRGELLIIAPGLKRFGEQPEVDALIRKYGYRGTGYTLEHYRRQSDMQDLAHATAHLIHGSSEGRFRIAYAPGQFVTKGDRGGRIRICRPSKDARPIPARPLRGGLEPHGRRRRILLHRHSRSWAVGHSREARRSLGGRHSCLTRVW
jgi:nickel-dependent lactate racemase